MTATNNQRVRKHMLPFIVVVSLLLIVLGFFVTRWSGLKGLAVLVVVMAAVVLGFYFFLSTLILEGKIPFPQWARTLLMLTHTPADFSDDLVSMTIPMNKSPYSLEAILVPKYVGTYDGGLVLTGMDEGSMVEPKKFHGKITCVFLQDHREVFSISSGGGVRERYYFGGNGYGRPRDILFTFSAPRDIPLRKQLKLIVRVEEPDTDYEVNYGPLEFFLRKQIEY